MVVYCAQITETYKDMYPQELSPRFRSHILLNLLHRYLLAHYPTVTFLAIRHGHGTSTVFLGAVIWVMVTFWSFYRTCIGITVPITGELHQFWGAYSVSFRYVSLANRNTCWNEVARRHRDKCRMKAFYDLMYQGHRD